MSKAVLYTDGGSRGNPGIAGLGFALEDEHGSCLMDGGWYLKFATNNVAEYSALIWGLKNARDVGITHLVIHVDSELIAHQINGIYKVKSPDLKPLHEEVKLLMARFSSASISHVYRSENAHADKLANEAMDALGPVGSYTIPFEEYSGRLFDDLFPTNLESEKENDNTMNVSQTAQSSQKKGTIMDRNAPYEGPGKLSGESYEHSGGHYELTVKDHFDAAHTLPGYPGQCQYLHGHTWEIEVIIAGEHLDEVGILYDFKAIKDSLHNILENFDHRYINDTPPFDIINPTAEHMARVIYYELEKLLTPGVSLREVGVWESPAAKVSYRP